MARSIPLRLEDQLNELDSGAHETSEHLRDARQARVFPAEARSAGYQSTRLPRDEDEAFDA